MPRLDTCLAPAVLGVALAITLAIASAGCSVFEAPLQQEPGDGGALDAGSSLDARAPLDAPQVAIDASVSEDDDAGTTDASEPPDAPPSCVVASIVTHDVCDGPIVINEVDGSGEDFIEIYNRGAVAVNVSGYVLADDSAGSPDVAEGVEIPVGTVIEPGRHLYVWANLAAPQPGLRVTDCIPGAPPPCMHSSWGISAGGERVYLLDAALTVVCAFQYPSSVFGGESFGRATDGETTLCPLAPTPGAPNAPSTLR